MLMHKTLFDIVNFNCDASCLSTKEWFAVLAGGRESRLCQWLSLYVKHDKKIVLGLTGASVADIKTYNQDALDIINSHKDIFEIILRPFSHDIGLYRTEEGFLYNFELGRMTIEKEFGAVSDVFLPPEFMVNSRQIQLLAERGVNTVFINPGRYGKEVSSRIPPQPYELIATGGGKLQCIPIADGITSNYLNSLHWYDASYWNLDILSRQQDKVFSWRDGESVFLIPNGVDKEEAFLQGESDGIKREFMASLEVDYVSNELLDRQYYRSYPVHSFLAWMKEMKMLWFLQETAAIEANLMKLDDIKRYQWLQLINSDILASVEKKSPVVKIRYTKNSDELQEYTIYRSERGFEGEDMLHTFKSGCYSGLQHMDKLKARVNYLTELNADRRMFW